MSISHHSLQLIKELNTISLVEFCNSNSFDWYNEVFTGTKKAHRDEPF